MKVSKYTIVSTLALALLWWFTGCQSFAPASGLLETQSRETGVSTMELRPIVDDLVRQYASRVELAADEIILNTNDATVHKNALLWKSNGIAACFQGATRKDPLAAYVNIWILNKQSLDLFQRNNVPLLFGEQQGIAISATERLEESFEQILERIGRDFPIGEEFASRFATDHPIQNLYFDRASIAEHYTDYIAKISVNGKDLKEVVSGLDSQLDQLQKLSALYAEFVPKQARWQAELVVLDATRGELMQALMSELATTTDNLTRATAVAESLPDLVVREREFLRTAVTEERVATLEAIADLQSDTMDKLQQQLQRERVAVVEELKSERALILDHLQQERVAATNDFTSFGQTVFHQFDSSLENKMSGMAEHGQRLTDHFFKRAAQLGFVLMSTMLLALCWFYFQFARNRLSPAENESRRDHVGLPDASDEARRPSEARARRRAA